MRDQAERIKQAVTRMAGSPEGAVVGGRGIKTREARRGPCPPEAGGAQRDSEQQRSERARSDASVGARCKAQTAEQHPDRGRTKPRSERRTRAGRLARFASEADTGGVSARRAGTAREWREVCRAEGPCKPSDERSGAKNKGGVRRSAHGAHRLSTNVRRQSQGGWRGRLGAQPPCRDRPRWRRFMHEVKTS